MSIRDMMHSLLGQNTGLMAAQSSQMAQLSANIGAYNNAILGAEQARKSMNKKIFDGRIEVQQVANGFVVHIGRKEGYEYETHIAATITEVNEIIAAQIVAFKLEDRS